MRTGYAEDKLCFPDDTKPTVGRCRLTLFNQVESALKSKRSDLLDDEPPSNFAFKFNLHHYITAECVEGVYSVGRCSLTVSNPMLKQVRAYDFLA